KATCLPLRKFFPEYVAERAPLRKVLIFAQGDGFTTRPIDRDSGINRLVANDMMDREAFYRYMLAYATVFPSATFARHWDTQAGKLRQAIPETVSFIYVVVPPRISSETVCKIREIIEC